MKIGIFGGAFNPPHIGHVEAAKTAMVQHELELLIVVPTGTPPHKTLPSETPAPDIRLQMTKNTFCDVSNTVVSDIEIHSQDRNYTIDTVASIKREYPGAELFLLVGTDMYNSLHTWKNYKALLKTVFPVLLSRDIIDISSTQIREMLPKRGGAQYLSCDNYALIIKHRLYGARPNWDWLRERAHLMLDSGRIPHVDACEREAIRLARHWDVSIDDAREAAILHDITKRLDFTENMCIIAENGVDVGNLGKNGEKLLHSITGALIAKSEFGVSNTVAEAIRWHTTGNAGMSMLDKVIYISDYIESTRDFVGVESLRQAAYEDIDAAMITGLEMTVSDLLARGITPNISTFRALEDLVSTVSKGVSLETD